MACKLQSITSLVMTMIYYKMNHAFVLNATIDSKEFVIGHGYETTAIAKYHAKTITDLFLIKTCIYKVTKLEDRSLITEIIYDGERHFYNRLKREKRITESINSKLNPEEIKTVDPSIIDSLK